MGDRPQSDIRSVIIGANLNAAIMTEGLRRPGVRRGRAATTAEQRRWQGDRGTSAATPNEAAGRDFGFGR